MPKKKMFSIQAEAELLELFKVTCERNDQTQSQIIRQCMREYINTNKQPEQLTKPKKNH